MVFRSKVDRYFVITILIAIFILAISCFFPFFLEGMDAVAAIILIVTFVLSAGLIVWISIDIKYVLKVEHLFVKAGPFRRHIPYGEITKIAPSRDMLSGFRMLSSIDGLEVSYKSALMGGVKISPEDKALFVEELKKRCPNINS